MRSLSRPRAASPPSLPPMAMLYKKVMSFCVSNLCRQVNRENGRWVGRWPTHRPFSLFTCLQRFDTQNDITFLYNIAIGGNEGGDAARGLDSDLIEDFHCLYQRHDLTDLDDITDIDK